MRDAPKQSLARYPSILGMTFGRLTVLSFSDNAKWLCKCECGNTCFTTRGKLIRGHTKSCGCIRREELSKRKKTHGKTKTKIYRLWTSMIQRCTNKNNVAYKDYGGRGIFVCDRWSGVDGFIHFFEDMGLPEAGLSLDRIDNDKGYSKENCKWSTKREQRLNSRRIHLVTYNGRTVSMSVLCEEEGISYAMFKLRLKRGWSVEDAVKVPNRTDRIRKSSK